MKILILIALMVLVGCSGNKVKEVDTDLVVKGTSSLGDIGITNDKMVVIQKKTNADDELRRQQWTNNKLEDQVRIEWLVLKSCREDMADPRLGGNGEITTMLEIDNMKQPVEIKEEFGLTKDGSLQFVAKEDFLKRIQAERSYEETLNKMLKTITSTKEVCERKMGIARMKAGLPSQRIQGVAIVNAQGKIEKVIRKNENSLDDAFEIVKEEQSVTSVDIQQ